MNPAEVAMCRTLWERIYPEDFAVLSQKRRKLPVFTRNQPCPIDGMLTRDHQRCAGCHVVTGDQHAVKALQDGYCPSCWRVHARATS